MDVPTDRLPIKGLLKDLGHIPEIGEIFFWSGQRWVCVGHDLQSIHARPAPDR